MDFSGSVLTHAQVPVGFLLLWGLGKMPEHGVAHVPLAVARGPKR